MIILIKCFGIQVLHPPGLQRQHIPVQQLTMFDGKLVLDETGIACM